MWPRNGILLYQNTPLQSEHGSRIPFSALMPSQSTGKELLLDEFRLPVIWQRSVRFICNKYGLGYSSKSALKFHMKNYVCEASSDEEDVVDMGKRTSLSSSLLSLSTLLDKPWLALKM
jgi:hypothetical protein